MRRSPRSGLVPRGAKREGGFTLLEIILAVALCALVMGLVYGIVLSTIQAAERVDELTAGSEIGPAILALIREDVAAAFLPGKDQDYFVGQSKNGRDRFDFISSSAVFAAETAGAEPAIHSVNEMGYQVKEAPGGGGLVLYRRVDPFIDAEPLRGGRLTAVVDNVLSFKVSYWDGKDWQPTWIASKMEDKLPMSVRIELKIRVTDRTAEGGHADRTFMTIIPFAK